MSDVSFGEMFDSEDVDNCPVCGSTVREYSFDSRGRDGRLEPCGHPIPPPVRRERSQ